MLPSSILPFDPIFRLRLAKANNLPNTTGLDSLEGTNPLTTGASPDQIEAIKQALYAGHKIMAIKLYRGQNRVGLADAKNAVEKLEAQLRLSSPGSFSAPPASKGCLFAVLSLGFLGMILWKLLT